MNTSPRIVTKKLTLTHSHGNRIESKLQTDFMLCNACVTNVKYAVEERIRFVFLICLQFCTHTKGHFSV